MSTIATSISTLLTIWLDLSAHFKDPTDPSYYLELQIGQRIENREAFGFCNFCDRMIKLGSKHCRTCNRCIDSFDHHCTFVNLCIGKANYHIFVFLCVSLAFDMAYKVFHYFVIFFDNYTTATSGGYL